MNPSDCLARDAIRSSGDVGAMRVMCLSVVCCLNSVWHSASSGGRSRRSSLVSGTELAD